MSAEVHPLRPGDGPDPGNALRVPPHNYEAERALLGAILMNNRAFERVSDFLLEQHFADPVNAVVYGACRTLIERGRPANPVTLKIIATDPLVAQAGGSAYIASLLAGAVTVVNAGEYGQLVYDLYLRRELIAVGEDMVNRAFDGTLEDLAVDQLEEAEQRLFELAATSASGGLADASTAADGAIALAEAAHKHGGALVGVTTGLRDLDAKLSGLHPSDLIILAGRPSMGKTGLALTTAIAAARYFQNPAKPEDKGKQVAFFSLEMSKEQLATRVLSKLANLDSHRIRAGHLRQEEFERLFAARDEFSALPLKIDDSPAPSIAAIRARARRLARKGGLGLIVVDYLQLIAAAGRERPENRVQEISAITRGLKALAKDLRVPVLALSQLSRAVEARDDKRPQLADLRESGTIEQDADAVMFVYREQYYLERSEPQQRADESSERYHERHAKWETLLEAAYNVGEVILGKQRHGPIGTVRSYFDASSTWWGDLDAHQPGQPRAPAGPANVSHETSGPPQGHPAAMQGQFWEEP